MGTTKIMKFINNIIIHLSGQVKFISSNLRRLLSTIRYFSISNYFSIIFVSIKNLFIGINKQINSFWPNIRNKIIPNVNLFKLFLTDANRLNHFVILVFQKEGVKMFEPKIVAPIFFGPVMVFSMVILIGTNFQQKVI